MELYSAQSFADENLDTTRGLLPVYACLLSSLALSSHLLLLLGAVSRCCCGCPVLSYTFGSPRSTSNPLILA